MRISAVQALFVMSSLLGTSAWCAGPVLTPQQVQSAIQEGSKYRTLDQYLEKGFNAKPLRWNKPGRRTPDVERIQLASNMSKDGISKYATFYNDWRAIAAESAAAHQQMRDLKPEDVQSKGLLHAFVEVHGRGLVGEGRLDRRYGHERAHLVLKIGGRIIQPVDKSMIYRSGDWVTTALLAPSGKITLDFAFDVSPEDLQKPVEVILIDGDGNKHHKVADLSGILSVD
jgi:hypothetical protein